MATNFTSILKALVRIKKGQPISEVVTTDRINGIQDAITGLANGDNLIAGANVSMAYGPGWVKISAAKGEGGGGGVAAEEKSLRLFNATKGEGAQLGITYGTIANRHPEGFKAGGIPPFTVSVSGGQVFVYAYGEVDLSTRLFTKSGIKVSSSSGLQNTINTVYKFIGSAAVETINGKTTLSVVNARYGPVAISACETANPE